MKQRRWLFIGGCVLLVLAAAGLGVKLWLGNAAEPADQPPADPAGSRVENTPLIVTLVSPGDGSRWAQDAGLLMETVAYSPRPLTRVELWLDSSLLAVRAPEEPGGSYYYTRWKWEPFALGEHLLMARAIDDSGKTVASNPVRITITKPAGVNLLVPAADGDTLDTLAIRYNSSVEAIQDANPALDLSRPSVEQRVLVPQAPAPVEAGRPGGGMTLPDLPRKPGILIPAEAINRIFDPRKESGSVPAAPQLTASAQGCDINLTVQDQSDNEDGFQLYRVSGESSAKQPLAALQASDGSALLTYTDPGQSGLVTYLAGAYNAGGESTSNPAVVTVDAKNCRNLPSLPGSLLVDQRIYLDRQVDAAYLYISVDGGPYKRYPEDPQAFLPNPGEVVDLQSALNATGAEANDLGSSYNVELWGWSAETLQMLGQFLGESIDVQTQARICPPGVSCEWEDAIYQIKMEGRADARTAKMLVHTNASQATHAILNFYAVGEHTDLDFSDEHPMFRRRIPLSAEGSDRVGVFHFDVQEELNTVVTDHRFVVTIEAAVDNEPIGEPSNMLMVTIKPLMPESNDKAPGIYGVTLHAYSHPSVPNPAYWGCIFINNDFSHGICPANLEEPSDLEFLVTGICDGVVSAWGTAIEFINTVKNAVVEAVARVLNEIAPGLCEGQTCRDRLMSALDVAITAFTGMPPNLPDFEKMMDEGVDYMVSMAATEFGVPCEADCQQVISDGIQEAVAQAHAAYTTPSCNDGQAAAHGKQAWCPEFPPGTVITPALDAIYQPASVEVRISRYHRADEPEEQPAGSYILRISSYIKNEWAADQNFRLCGFYNGDVSFIPGETYPVNQTLKGEPFQTVTIPLPNIKPDTWIEIPVVLQGVPYEIPKHTLKVHDIWGPSKWDSCIIDDWPMLYYGGDLTLTAEILCADNLSDGYLACSSESTYCWDGNTAWKPCDSAHTLDLENPTGPWWLNP